MTISPSNNFLWGVLAAATAALACVDILLMSSLCDR